MSAVVSLDAGRAYVARVLEAHNTAPKNAAAVARALVAAQAYGINGHGFSRLPSYAAQVKSGKVDGHAVPALEQVTPVVLRVDAGTGFAYPALEETIDALVEAVKTYGLAAAAVHRSHHAGAMGLWVERLARAGLVGQVYANSPSAMAPWGGNRAIYGTNPIAFGAPLDGRDPLVIDLSLSKVARGNVMKAAQEGKPIPEGWALDGDGQPTTDAKAALDGMMIPMGDAKGAALALMVETLSAAMPAAHFAFEASSYFAGEGPAPETGQFLFALDPARFSGGAFAARMRALVDALEAQPGARLPGVRRMDLYRAAQENGVTVPQAVIDAVGAP